MIRFFWRFDFIRDCASGTLLANYVTGALQLFDLLPYKEIAPIFGETVCSNRMLYRYDREV